MKRHIDEEIDKLKEKILRMGGIAEEMIHCSSKIFGQRKAELCPDVLSREEEVNRLQKEVDEDAVKVLALYQPEATDLRTILAAIKINAELERVADQAVNIAQTTSYYLLKEAPVGARQIPRMATIAQQMIRGSLDAFARRDVELARSVIQMDQEEDALKFQVLDEIVGLLPSHPEHSRQFIDLILIAKNLEKIGDHATNIAEDVIFMVLGKDIRHPAQDAPLRPS